MSRSTSNNQTAGQNNPNAATTSTSTSTQSAETSNATPKSKSSDTSSKVGDKRDPQGEDSTQQAGSTSAPAKSERPRSSAQFGERDVKRASRLLNSALPKPAPKASTTESAPASNVDGVDKDDEKDVATTTSEVADGSSTSAAAQGASTNPKTRQPMPQSQPPIKDGSVPGNFSSRGRGRGQFHHNHPANFGHRGGHHGSFHGHHHNHFNRHHSQQHLGSSATADAKDEVAKAEGAPANDHQEKSSQEDKAATGTDTPISNETPPSSSKSLKTGKGLA